MKKIICILSFVFILVLSGCTSDRVYLENSENYDYYMKNYYIENERIDSSVSYHYLEYTFSSEKIFSLNTFENLESIQDWLNNNRYIDIIGVIPFYNSDSEIRGFNIALKQSNFEHNYKIGITPSNPNLYKYSAAIYLPEYSNSSGESTVAHYIVIYEVR